MMPFKSSSPPWFVFFLSWFFSCILGCGFCSSLRHESLQPSHTTGAAEICPRPKAMTKTAQIPSGSPNFSFLQDSIYSALSGASILAPPKVRPVGDSRHEWEMGERKLKKKTKPKPPSPHSESSPEPELSLGKSPGCDEHQLSVKRTKIPHSKLLQHRTDIPKTKAYVKKQFQGR